jgi:bifunctional non-homologous end joining protein LigD
MVARKLPESKAAQAVDKQLDRYRSMRDFQSTSEPRGGARAANGKDALPFVVQKHAATRLHYDFRLGWRGVLKSWAVTKGPSYYPGDKRLAVQVEDHPIEYGGFEGTIPKGQYGGGTVMVWDFGNWQPEGDVDRGLADGHLKFELHGKKLKGKWALVRMHGDAGRADKPNWLLIKEKDEFARPQDATPITDEATDSAITHRGIEQIAESKDHVWNSRDSSDNGSTKRASQESNRTRIRIREPKRANVTHGSIAQSAPREAFPGFIAPQLAQQASKAPIGDDWVHELKLDGYRIQIHLQSKGKERLVRLLTRKGLDWTARMPDIAQAAAQLQVKNAILDGEVVALDKNGVSSFADLQAAFQEGKKTYLTYFAFDLLYLDGRNIRALPLLQRKELLAGLIGHSDDSPLRLSEHLQANGDEVFKKACALGAEGIISKLASAKYSSGRGTAWLKVKCIQEQEFVVGGFTLPSKGGPGIGALLLGYYEAAKLRYAGRSGTGFTQQTQRSLRTKLEELTQKASVFVDLPGNARRSVHWVKPKLVAQIAFATWTRDNLVRQAAFKGLREDKPAAEVIREKAVQPEAQLRRSGGAARKSATQKKSNGKGGMRMVDLPITHPDKILDDESGMTKQALAEYYLAVAEHMLPHIADRPLSVVRCPEGSGKPCFYQKHVGMGLPKGVNSISISNRKTGKKEEFLTLNTAEGLVGMAQMGVLEIHPWGSRNESLEKPDRIIFDLDPDTAIDWQTLTRCALELQKRLKKVELVSFVKSTGGKGLHVVIPIRPQHEWAEVKELAHKMVLSMEKEKPDLYITKMTKSARAGRIYLDYLRNDRESTAVAPWSPRARSGAPVAMPLEWRELKADKAPAFHVSDFSQWQARLARDPWKTMNAIAQDLPAA